MNRFRKFYSLKSALLFPIFCFWQIVCIYAQDKEILISGDYSNLPLKDVILDIESKYPYQFYYLSDWDSLSVSINLSDVSLQLFLDEMSESTGLSFFSHSNGKVIVTSGINISPKVDGLDSSINNAQENFSVLFDQSGIFEEDEIDEIEQIIIEIGDISDRNKGNTATIAGYLKVADTGEPMIGATVSIKDPVMGVVADQYGYYSITLSKGTHEIHFNSIGMKATKRQVVLYGDGILNLGLKDEIVALKEVIVSAERDNVDNLQTGVASLNMQNIKDIPTMFGEADIMKIALMLPGVQTVGEGASGFNVRGGGIDQNLILLNDVPVYNTNHLFGFFSVFNPDVISNANLYKSGMRARYGGRVSSVFDVALREGNKKKFSAKGGISPATAKVTVEGPIKQDTSSFIIGVRSTYSDWILSLLDDPALRNSNASFSDLTARFNFQIDPKNTLILAGYHSRDRFQLNSDTIYRYFNSNLALQWRHTFSNQLYAITSIAYANYTYNLTGGEEGISGFEMDYSINDTSLKTNFNYFPNARNRMSFGLSSTWYNLHPGEKRPLGAASLVDKVSLATESGVETAIYAGNEFEMNSRLSFYAGLRLSMFTSLGPAESFVYNPEGPKEIVSILDTISYKSGEPIKTYGGPELRFSTRYKLSADVSVKFSYDRTQQFIHVLSNTVSVSPTDTWRLSSPHIKPQVGDQVSAGIYKRFFGTGIEASVEGYYKRVKNVLEYKDGASLLLNEVLETEVINSLLKAYGLEFLIKKKTGKFNGWLSYTYSRSLVRAKGTYPSERINSGEFFPSNFDRPHVLVLVSNYKFNRRISTSLNVTYNSGRPSTIPQTEYQFNGQPLVFYTNRNEFRIPDYFRVDLAVNLEGNHRVHKRVHGSWSLSIYNLTGRDNAYSVFFKTQNAEIKGFKLSVFSQPIPTITYNFQFR